jgi:hypothetical protein
MRHPRKADFQWFGLGAGVPVSIQFQHHDVSHFVKIIERFCRPAERIHVLSQAGSVVNCFTVAALTWLPSMIARHDQMLARLA